MRTGFKETLVLRTSYFVLLLFLAPGTWHPTPAFAQEIRVSVPVHPVYVYSQTGPLMTFQQDAAPATTGNETEWRDKSGALKCWADANGQLNCVNGFGGTPTRDCTIVAGSNNGAVLANADIAPQSYQCKIPKAATVIEIDVHGDAGTSSVTVDSNYNGAQTSLLSAPLATTGSGGEACANVAGGLGLDGITTCSATLQNVSITGGSYFETLTASASGTAHIFSVSIVFTMP